MKQIEKQKNPACAHKYMRNILAELPSDEEPENVNTC